MSAGGQLVPQLLGPMAERLWADRSTFDVVVLNADGRMDPNTSVANLVEEFRQDPAFAKFFDESRSYAALRSARAAKGSAQ